MTENISALEYGKSLGLYLKMVVSVSTFDDYNSFFNIYSEYEEACRRIMVLTPYEDLEEVNDSNPSEKFKRGILIDGSFWLEDYPLTINPSKINLEEVTLDKETIRFIESQRSIK